MGRMMVEFRYYVLRTEGGAFEHLISDRVGRTWCNRIDYKMAVTIEQVYDHVALRGDPSTWDSLCPGCKHYVDWIIRNSAKPLS